MAHTLTFPDRVCRCRHNDIIQHPEGKDEEADRDERHPASSATGFKSVGAEVVQTWTCVGKTYDGSIRMARRRWPPV